MLQFDVRRSKEDGVHLRHILLTYLLTPWSRVLLEKLTGLSANQEIPRSLWNPKAHYRTHKRRVKISYCYFLEVLLLVLYIKTYYSNETRFNGQGVQNT